MGDFLLYLRGICLASGFALHIAPIPTMREIVAARSTLNYHIAPYASTLLNHSINGLYAYVRKDPALMTHRFLGVIASCIYLYIYLGHCPPARQADNKKWLSWVIGIIICVVIELYGVLPLFGLEKYFFSNIALFGAITGIGLAAAPLATVGEVVRQRDASSLPFAYCCMVALQCTCWMIYGYMVDDVSTFANNAVGSALGATQLFLIFTCPSKRSGSSASFSKPKSSGSNSDLAGTMRHHVRPDGLSSESLEPLSVESPLTKEDEEAGLLIGDKP